MGSEDEVTPSEAPVFEAWDLPPDAPEPASWEEAAAPGGGVMRYPRWGEGGLAALAGSLRAARSAHLVERPARELAGLLGSVGRRFLDPGDPLTRRALEALPATAGVSPAMARTILEGMARDWTAERLGALLDAGFADPAVLDGFRPGPGGSRVRALGTPLTVHVGAGNVAGVTVTSLLRALLVKSAALVKPGAGDAVLPVLFARGLREADPEVAAALAVAYWPGAGAATAQAVGAADLVVAYGGTAAIRRVRGALPPTVPLVAYHHRVGAALVGRDRLARGELEATARAAARAVAVFDQRGCVSPHVLYVEEGGEAAPGEFAGAVAGALAALEEELPSGPLTAGEASELQQLRGSAEMEQAAGTGVEVWSGGEAPWTVVLDPDPRFEPSCTGRVVRVKPVSELREAVERLREVGPFLQTVGLAGAAGRTLELAEALGRLGATRVTPLEAVPWPPPWGHPDGAPPLGVLVRWTDLEIREGP